MLKKIFQRLIAVIIVVTIWQWTSKTSGTEDIFKIWKKSFFLTISIFNTFELDIL